MWCHRIKQGEYETCIERWPDQPVRWCQGCHEAYESALEERAIQAAWDNQFNGWFLASGDRPAWSLAQVSRPSPN